jgi:hypothetical protein
MLAAARRQVKSVTNLDPGGANPRDFANSSRISCGLLNPFSYTSPFTR